MAAGRHARAHRDAAPPYTRPVPNRIDDIFAELRAGGRKALMPFVCGGHPGPGVTGRLIRGAAAGGASIVEVGIPFSDPIADGPVIAAAMHAALAAGATAGSVIEEVAAERAGLSVGVVAMVSISIISRMGGPSAFAERLAGAGFDGIIVPDLPLEESGDMRQAAAARGLVMSLLIAPTTPWARAEQIARACTGFVYLLARAGITGEQEGAPEVRARVQKLRQATGLPIAVGFGISSPEHVRAVVRDADAAIVGSALVRRIGEAARAGSDPAAACEAFVRSLAGGLE